MVQTYYGNGKGKTTAAIGAAIRCAGCGGKVLFVQFLKNNNSSEIKILNQIKEVDILFSDENYKLYDNLNKERTSALSDAYSKLLFDDVKNKAKLYHMIVLDEILDAVDFGYIDKDMLLQFIKDFKNQTEFVMTGHSLTEKFSDISDYISEIKEIKHPYSKGALPRKGIEY